MKAKTMMAVFFALATAVATAQEMTLAAARAKIGDVVSNPTAMAAVMKGLSAADQRLFLNDVNEAISRMPGSLEAKTASYLAANGAALKSAKKGNLTTLLSEVFATLPPEALTVINENFAADLFNRASNPAVTYVDDQYAKIALDAFEKIHERNKSSDNPAVRDAFAIMMFVRASNGTPTNLTDRLVANLDSDARELAKSEWLPQALSTGPDKTYESILAAADAGHAPNPQVVLRISGPQSIDSLLADLFATPVDEKTGRKDAMPMSTMDDFDARPGTQRYDQDFGMSGINRVPFYYDRAIFGTDAGTKGSGRQVGDGPIYATEKTDPMYFDPGQKIPAGSKNVGDDSITIVTPGGKTEVLDPGDTTKTGGTVTSPEGAVVKLPPGTPIAPGGQAVGPGGLPVGPGGRKIQPGSKREPGGYNNQY